MLGWWLGLTDLPSVTLPQGINTVGPSNVDLPGPFKPGMYELEIVLRKGNNLAIRDRRGTSDPYVKFKITGKEVFRSKTIHKNLNPVWDEKVTLLVDSLKEPLYVKVFDYDFGLQDDFMGSSYLYLESLEHLRTLDVILELKDPQYPDHDLGSLELAVTLTPKEGSFKDAHQSLRLSDIHRKAQLWRGIVSISLIEGRNLQPMDANGLSDPYVKFKMGHQKYKSKTIHKTLNPQWREQFDFHLYDERGGVIDITLWDRDAGKRDDFMGRCQVDISLLSKECTHRLDLSLEEGEGTLALLVTLTASAAVSIADLSVNVLDDPRERKEILHRYSLLRSFNNIKDVGIVQVKVIRAEGLMAADVTGKSDPFCVVELSNDRLQTHTVYKNLNPEWNKVFMFNVKDIHSVLEVTVYDEDRDRSADFLGKVSIPLLSIQNGERKAYALKSKEMTVPTKGVIFLEMDVIYNAVKAGLRTLIPIEQKYIEEEPRVSKQLLLRNFNRVRRCFMVLFNAACYVNSCFEWESPQRSICAFLLFVVVVWNFELYMVPLALLLPLAWNYALIASGKDVRQGDVVSASRDSERKGFMNKLYAIQDVCISVQSALDEVASYGERIKNTFNWTVPFLSWLAIVALCVVTVIVYFIPLRYIVLAWGVNKFTKKLRDPYTIDNNELLDFLSRVPSDVQVVQYRELKLDPSHSPNKRKKNNPG
uniref:C2 domain-containing protein n=1 Tax=Electrophorus electricus TaxID=8005 RepID=A0A4W4G225_ELEEL